MCREFWGYRKTEGKYSRKGKLGRGATFLRLAFRLFWKGYGCNPLDGWVAEARPRQAGNINFAGCRQAEADRHARGVGWCYGCKAWSTWCFFQEGHRKQPSGSWGASLWPGVPHMCQEACGTVTRLGLPETEGLHAVSTQLGLSSLQMPPP